MFWFAHLFLCWERFYTILTTYWTTLLDSLEPCHKPSQPWIYSVAQNFKLLFFQLLPLKCWNYRLQHHAWYYFDKSLKYESQTAIGFDADSLENLTQGFVLNTTDFIIIPVKPFLVLGIDLIDTRFSMSACLEINLCPGKKKQETWSVREFLVWISVLRNPFFCFYICMWQLVKDDAFLNSTSEAVCFYFQFWAVDLLFKTYICKYNVDWLYAKPMNILNALNTPNIIIIWIIKICRYFRYFSMSRWFVKLSDNYN